MAAPENPAASPGPASPGPSLRSSRKVALASLVGTTIEWYDFFIFGTAAALVFDQIFFPAVDPLAGTLAAFAAFAVGFVARPFGGVLFAHFGDRVGRKPMLVYSLLLMGGATLLMGVLPGYASIGAIFGGFAPLISTALVGLTGSLYSVAGYVIVLALISLTCSYLMTETVHSGLRSDAPARAG
jgi:MHS family shikimate/dehydroshikimate transporter-like MFS transporter